MFIAIFGNLMLKTLNTDAYSWLIFSFDLYSYLIWTKLMMNWINVIFHLCVINELAGQPNKEEEETAAFLPPKKGEKQSEKN